MGFRDLNIERAYDSGDASQEVLSDFYLPVLQESVSYDRLTGFFSSGSLAVAARGIAGLIRNGGSMRIVASPFFTPKDVEALNRRDDAESMEAVLEQALTSGLDDLESLADAIAIDHVRAMGWLMREGRLDVRVVVPDEIGAGNGLFHQKIGVLRDENGDLVSFSGSINETAAGWLENIEEFKVFRSWETGEREWVNHDASVFSRYWNAGGAVGCRAVPLPEAARRKLIEIAPVDLDDLDLAAPRPPRVRTGFKLRDYQAQAVAAWVDNAGVGILEMATGTGKTKTAVACTAAVSQRAKTQLTVVTAPYQHISVQWAKEFEGHDPICTFENGDWRGRLRDALADLRFGLRQHIVVIAVQNTAAMDDFLAAAKLLADEVEQTLLIADEVHGLGAPTMRRALADFYTMRLGLSATPQRWFDEDGSTVLTDYFQRTVFTFGIHEALSWIDPETGLTPLCPYEYHPVFVELQDEEIEEYSKLTDRIVREMQASKEDERNETLELLLFKRAAIVKTAAAKIGMLESLLSGIEPVGNCLIYCHNSSQMEDVRGVLSSRGIRFHKFTGEEGTSAKAEFGGVSEREWILKDLEAGNTQALIAMKCLDEGVDVPMARLGLILASSGNPREFIQRRGRLLRRAPGKERAIIYDVVVRPSIEALKDPVARDLERRVFQKELARMGEFADDAINGLEIRTAIVKMLATLM